MTQPQADLEYGTTRGRVVLAAAVLASGVAFLDSTVVNVALPAIGRDLDAGLPVLQWIVDGYLLTLGSLVLVGGSLGDLLGKRRVFETGLIAFGVASFGCGLAPSGELLVAARLVQGAAAALLVPNSLAVLTSTFRPADRGRAIGAWSGLAGVSTVIGPFAGGWLVDAASWRFVFLINLPFIAAALVLSRRGIPDLPGTHRPGNALREVDVGGSVLATAGLAVLVFPLIEYARLPAGLVWGMLALGVVLLVAAVGYEWARERAGRAVTLPVSLFSVRMFTAANVVTLAVYGALGGAMFLLSITLQIGLGYSALEAGLSTLPITILLLLLSARVGALLPRVGVRLPLTAGPLISATGLLLLTGVHEGSSYWTAVFPGVVVFGAGLCLIVAPVTTAAMADVERQHAGAASGINNAVARIAGLFAIAALPVLVGLDPDALREPAALIDGFGAAMWICAGLCVAGALAALTLLPAGPVHRRVGAAAGQVAAGR
ncbi:MAG TPA: MFS transporter [Actinomycetes bacterium]|nr:MFS transporter [Actinomycetes bacterium]